MVCTTAHGRADAAPLASTDPRAHDVRDPRRAGAFLTWPAQARPVMTSSGESGGLGHHEWIHG